MRNKACTVLYSLYSLWLRNWVKLYRSTLLWSTTLHFIRPVEYMTFEVRKTGVFMPFYSFCLTFAFTHCMWLHQIIHVH